MTSPKVNNVHNLTKTYEEGMVKKKMNDVQFY